MELIALYEPYAADFSTLGLGALTPSECTVTWQAAGTYELTLVQPIDETNRWAQLANGCIIAAPVPVRESPLYEYGVGGGSGGSESGGRSSESSGKSSASVRTPMEESSMRRISRTVPLCSEETSPGMAENQKMTPIQTKHSSHATNFFNRGASLCKKRRLTLPLK